MVDTNCAWTPGEATAAVAAMAPSKPFWIEEPIWPPEDFESLAALRSATGVPLAMGENATSVLEFRKMVAAGATDFVQPSVVKVGGLTNLWRVATEADQGLIGQRGCAGVGRRLASSTGIEVEEVFDRA